MDSQAGLAAAPRTDQSDQGFVGQQPLQLRQLGVAAHEAGPLHRQVVRPGVQRPQRRELDGKVRIAELEDPLGARQVLEPMDTQVDQPRPLRQVVGGQLSGRLGQHRLAAVGRIADPGRPVDGRTGVVALIPAQHITGMDPDTKPQRSAGQSPLDGQSAGHAVAGPGEGGHETVPLPLLDRPDPVVASHRLVDHRVEGGQLRSPWPSASDSQARVDPSTSPSTNVTVPVGNTKFPSPMDGSPHRNGRTNTGRPTVSLIAPTVRTPAVGNIGQPAYPGIDNA